MKRKREIAIMVLAPICYIIGTVSVLKGEAPVAVLFFCMESVLLVALAYLFSLRNPNVQDEENVDEELLLTMEQDAMEYKQRINALERELEERVKEHAEESLEKDAEKESLKARIEYLESQGDKEASEVFLPPVEENEPDVETIDIIATAKETAKELESFAKEAGIDVEVSTSFEELLVKGNRSRMRIMFRNIIDNSIKYMKKEGRLIITISSIGEDIFIVLKDNGNGLDEDETRHIFELNYQGSNRISGNGLGLTQAKAIVDYYGGTIYAKSNKDRGMGIYIQLPTT